MVKKQITINQAIPSFEEYRQKDIYLKNVLNAELPVSFYWMDREGTILGCNETQAHMYGFSSYQEFIGKSTYHLRDKFGWSDEMCNTIRQNDIVVMETGKPVVREEYVEVNTEHRTYLSHKSPLVNESGDIVGVFGFSVDITDRKEAEQLKIEKTAAEKREETLRLLSASIAHELRTPLRGIDANLSGIEDYLPTLIDAYHLAEEAGLNVKKIDAESFKLLEQAFQSAKIKTQDAFNVVDMLLVKTGQLNIDPTKFVTYNILECLYRSLNNYHFEIDERELVCVNEKCHFHFYGDDFLMRHVFFNLIKNALYFIRVAGKGNIEIWCETLGKTNKLYFKDTSTGIAPDVLSHIFDMYYSQVTHGTGIGLAFCKMVMNKLGGDITCDSKEGEYTCFTLTFPAINQ